MLKTAKFRTESDAQSRKVGVRIRALSLALPPASCGMDPAGATLPASFFEVLGLWKIRYGERSSVVIILKYSRQ